ncbi:MAG TPA: hypothetical protein VJL58_01775 [Pyrinomonadaceae bacterium]|nr:hypothetical protein [Pyrinomonadaceae bacterium]
MKILTLLPSRSAVGFVLGLAAVVVSFSSVIVAQTCGLQFRTGSADPTFDSIFTQDGPGLGLEPTGAAGWTGGDSTYSIELPNGDTAFFFSDSYIGESPRLTGDGTVTTNSAGLRTREANCFPPLCNPPTVLYRAHNSVVIRNKTTGTLTTLMGAKDVTGYSTSYFAPPASAATGRFYWMGDSAVIQASSDGTQKLWVFLLEFDSSWAFHGSAIAQLSLPSLEIESIQPLLNLQDTSSVHWGAALYLEGTFGNYTLYVYGMNATTAQKRPYVARTSMVGNLVDASNTLNWSVWSGGGWTPEFAAASPVIGAPSDPNNASDSISDEFSVKRVHTNSGPVFLLVGMDTTPVFGAWKDITIYTSCNPAGPFSAKSVVYSTPETGYNRVPGMTTGQFLAGNMFTYNPHLHPQFTSKGRLLISYNINAGRSADLLFADTYRPRFIRVPVRGERGVN